MASGGVERSSGSRYFGLMTVGSTTGLSGTTLSQNRATSPANGKKRIEKSTLKTV